MRSSTLASVDAALYATTSTPIFFFLTDPFTPATRTLRLTPALGRSLPIEAGERKRDGGRVTLAGDPADRGQRAWGTSPAWSPGSPRRTRRLPGSRELDRFRHVRALSGPEAIRGLHRGAPALRFNAIQPASQRAGRRTRIDDTGRSRNEIAHD